MIGIKKSLTRLEATTTFVSGAIVNDLCSSQEGENPCLCADALK